MRGNKGEGAACRLLQGQGLSKQPRACARACTWLGVGLLSCTEPCAPVRCGAQGRSRAGLHQPVPAFAQAGQHVRCPSEGCAQQYCQCSNCATARVSGLRWRGWQSRGQRIRLLGASQELAFSPVSCSFASWVLKLRQQPGGWLTLCPTRAAGLIAQLWSSTLLGGMRPPGSWHAMLQCDASVPVSPVCPGSCSAHPCRG